MKELLSGSIAPVTNIIEKVLLDKDEPARLAHEISTMADQHAQELALAQVEMEQRGSCGQLVPSVIIFMACSACTPSGIEQKCSIIEQIFSPRVIQM